MGFEKVDLVEMIRRFKREGIENFIVIKKQRLREEFIPKSVIREKIEELEKIKLTMTYSDKYFDANIQGSIDILKELLG